MLEPDSELGGCHEAWEKYLKPQYFKANAAINRTKIILEHEGLSSVHSPPAVETFVHGAAALLSASEGPGLDGFDTFPAPLYATDERGTLIYFNRACVDFAGRVPSLGEDQYCISWKLRSEDGAPLPHDQCPMAVALRETRAVRGVEAYAERPDGGRRRFRPFATPALDEQGLLVGAVNLLVPTDDATCRALLATAQKCRRLAQWVDDRAANKALVDMAAECESQAAVLKLN